MVGVSGPEGASQYWGSQDPTVDHQFKDHQKLCSDIGEAFETLTHLISQPGNGYPKLKEHLEQAKEVVGKAMQTNNMHAFQQVQNGLEILAQKF